MAKSKNGGSRAFIRGRIGSDVYSVGKNGQGARQQVVRSLAVQVSNPRTQSQMVGRMLMSTVMQAVSAMSMIIDHSFDGVAKGQPSISKFISENYARMKNYYYNLAEGEKPGFNFNNYQEKGILTGSYVISDGNVAPLNRTTDISDSQGYGCLKIVIPAGTAASALTMGWLKEHFQAGADGYITLVNIDAQAGQPTKFHYQRIALNLAKADTDVFTSQNISEFFICEGDQAAGFYMESAGESDNGFIFVECGADPQYEHSASYGETFGAIVSKKTENGWEHSRVELSIASWDAVDYRTKASSLATYPTGTAQFLNGGDL